MHIMTNNPPPVPPKLKREKTVKKKDVKDIEDVNVIETYEIKKTPPPTPKNINEDDIIMPINEKVKRIRNKNVKNEIINEMLLKNCNQEIIDKLKNIWNL